MPLLYINSQQILFWTSLVTFAISLSGVLTELSLAVLIVLSVVLILSVVSHIRNIAISKSLINALSILFVAYPLLGLSLENILLPSIEALTLITAARTLGEKRTREYFQVFLLSVLLLGASSLLEFSILFFIRLLLILILSVFSIMLITYLRETSAQRIEQKSLVDILKFSALIVLLTIPLSAVFFIIIPRTPNPFLTVGPPQAKTGFTSTVSLGTVSTVEEDKTVVMRVYSKALEQSSLYWRIITFDTFDGKSWRREARGGEVEVVGETVNYTVVSEPLDGNYLPVLDFPSAVFLRGVVHEYPGVFRIEKGTERRLKYSAQSLVSPKVYEAKISEIYTSLPDSFSERLIRLSREITKGAKSPVEAARMIEGFLSRFEYSLVELPTGDNPIEDFVFNKRKGNCEYFATTMALMLRAVGVPTRVVGGFRGGTYNQIGGYYIVRASDAHLWVEVWSQGQWIRFDPSGSGRVQITREPLILLLIDYLWTTYILNFDLHMQIRILEALKSPKIDLNKSYIALTLIILLPLFVSFLIKAYKISQDPLNRFLRIMKRAGYVRIKSQGLEEFCHRVENSAIRESALEFVRFYYSRYLRDRDFTEADRVIARDLLKRLDETVERERSKN